MALASVLIAAGGGAPPADGDVRSGWILTFSDDFDGAAVDPARWGNGFGWGPSSRNTHGWCDPGHNRVAGGVLTQRITRRPRGGKPFSVGCLNTRGRFAQLYGHWEVRMRVAGCAGARGALWAKPADESWPPELDIVEVHGDRRRTSRHTQHWRDADGRHALDRRLFSGPDFAARFHVFGARWSPSGTVWFVDGAEVGRTRAGAAAMDDGGPFYALLNAQVYRASSTCGQPGELSEQQVDWVRVWRPAGRS